MSTVPRPSPLQLLPEGITRAAERTPDHPAVRMEKTELSYRQLDQQSNSVANMLLSNGVKHGDRVGLYAHKSPMLIAALYGIMKAGGAYVPINPDAPAAYIRHILVDCEIKILIAGETTKRVALSIAEELELDLVVGIDETNDGRLMGWSEVLEYPSTPSPIRVVSEDLAYVMFTSGSTGRPKGIMHTHRSGLAYGKVAASTFELTSDDRLANHAPLNFDLCLFELFGSVVVGATLVIIPEAHGRLPASFSQMLAVERVTVVNAVPFALVELLRRGALEERDLSLVRWVVFGGEVFPTNELRALMARLPGAQFANVYGPAEVNGVTYYIVPALPTEVPDPIPIGALYPGMHGMVLDEHDQEVTAGVTGELLINSPTHMAGYWRQEEMTAQSTLQRTRHDGHTERWHRTGDLVYQADDGLYRFIGRKDRMVKTRGHRVELDEIESVLLSHSDVMEAVAYVVPDDQASQRIEAAVSLSRNSSDKAPEPNDLKRFAGRYLPKYSIPTTIRIIPSVPRTSSGKADRVALVEQSLQGSVG